MPGRVAAPVIYAALALFVGSCGQRPRPQQNATKADTPSVRPERTGRPVAVTKAPAVTPEAPAGEPGLPNASALIGTWDLSLPAGVRGPLLSIAIDSARDSFFYGRLSRAFSGDLDVSGNFRPFEGTVDRQGAISITIATTSEGLPRVVFEGHLEDHRPRLSSFVWGGEEQIKPDRAWEFRKH